MISAPFIIYQRIISMMFRYERAVINILIISIMFLSGVDGRLSLSLPVIMKRVVFIIKPLVYVDSCLLERIIFYGP